MSPLGRMYLPPRPKFVGRTGRRYAFFLLGYSAGRRLGTRRRSASARHHVPRKQIIHENLSLEEAQRLKEEYQRQGFAGRIESVEYPASHAATTEVDSGFQLSVIWGIALTIAAAVGIADDAVGLTVLAFAFCALTCARFWHLAGGESVAAGVVGLALGPIAYWACLIAWSQDLLRRRFTHRLRPDVVMGPPVPTDLQEPPLRSAMKSDHGVDVGRPNGGK
jgi:hypothetical protein